ncbi:MAG: diacylglycerol kinase family lipid kinase [Zavarzinia sp.]|nr:diacylglycerol kinase family lipid kinase [Zavarzinia sp.]
MMTRIDLERPRHLAIIYNPVAGRRRGRRFHAALAALRGAGIEVALHETEAPGHATTLARRLADRVGAVDTIVAAGGDGTINEVVNGLAGTAMPLGIIPLGTANVLALELGLPRGPGAVAAVLAAGRTRPIGLGLARSASGERHFVVMAGVGYDAHVVAGVSTRWKRRLGKLAYVGEMLRQLGRFHFTPYRLSFNGGAAVEAASAIIANGRHYGGGFVCAPAADLGNGRLDACLFGDGGPLAAVKYGFALGLDLVPRLASVAQRPLTRVTIDGPSGDPLQGDGDIIARLPAEVLLSPHRISVLAPSAGPAES